MKLCYMIVKAGLALHLIAAYLVGRSPQRAVLNGESEVCTPPYVLRMGDRYRRLGFAD